jgi:hypothetical protein
MASPDLRGLNTKPQGLQDDILDTIEATSTQPSSSPEPPELISSVPICLRTPRPCCWHYIATRTNKISAKPSTDLIDQRPMASYSQNSA